MSRKGKFPIPLPKGVEVKCTNNEVTVKGPKATLSHKLMDGLELKIDNAQLLVECPSNDHELSKFHGLHRAIISNMVVGVTQGFEKKLEMVGVGYRASVQGKELDLQLGFSHPTRLPIPEGLAVKVDKNTNITISGSDAQVVGQYAAEVRAMRPPEPYQGKGIRYAGEYVRKKAGKAAGSKGK